MGGSSTPTHELRSLLPDLRGSARRLAEHVLSDPGAASRSSITSLARDCAVVPSTVSRLAAALGYEGFPDLRAALATEHGRDLQSGWERDIGSEMSSDDPPDRLLASLAAAQHRAARASVTALDVEVAARVADALVAAPTVLLHGPWADAVPLEELRMRLLRLGVHAGRHPDRTAALVAADRLSQGDLLLILSRSGSDRVAEAAAERARRRGAQVALVTGDVGGALAPLADHVLDTGVRSSTWSEHFAGRGADTLACALLWLLIAQRLPESLGVAVDLDGELEPENPR